MLKYIDALLNRYTMYRIIIYSLSGYLLIALALAAGGMVGTTPIGLLLSVAILCAACYSTNVALSWFLRVPHNTESWLVSALILACILPPASTATRGLAIALVGAVAMASKYIITFRSNHIFNPAAFGAFAVGAVGLIPVTWWVATPAMAPFTIVLGLIILRKQKRFGLYTAFAVAAMATFLLTTSIIGGQSAMTAATTILLSWPLIFFGSIMLTEPSTLPPTSWSQILFATIVGCLFASQLHVGDITTTPQVALLIGNLLTAIATPAIGTMLRLNRINHIAPTTFEFAFEPTGKKPLSFAPGQYIEWTLPHHHPDTRGNRRIFSIASSPTEPFVMLGTKQYSPGSSFKTALFGLTPGSLIRVAHVAGGFTLPENSGWPLLFVAGGIGITPYRSMLKYLVDSQQKRDIVLLYIVASEQDFVFKDILAQAEAIGLKTHFVVGSMTPENILAAVPDIAKRTAYLSGPDAMVTHYKSIVHKLGAKQTVTDHFTGY